MVSGAPGASIKERPLYKKGRQLKCNSQTDENSMCQIKGDFEKRELQKKGVPPPGEPIGKGGFNRTASRRTTPGGLGGGRPAKLLGMVQKCKKTL